MKIISIRDIAKNYQDQVGEVYYEMAEECAERVMEACNELVAEGLRGDKLQQFVNTHIKNVADSMCAADGEVDKDTGEPLDEAANLTRLYLLDRIDDVAAKLSPACGTWQVSGEGDERQLVFVPKSE